MKTLCLLALVLLPLNVMADYRQLLIQLHEENRLCFKKQTSEIADREKCMFVYLRKVEKLHDRELQAATKRVVQEEDSDEGSLPIVEKMNQLADLFRQQRDQHCNLEAIAIQKGHEDAEIVRRLACQVRGTGYRLLELERHPVGLKRGHSMVPENFDRGIPVENEFNDCLAGAEGDREIIACETRALTAINKILAQVYKEKRAFLTNELSRRRGLNPAVLDAEFAASQRAWELFRDKECSVAYDQAVRHGELVGINRRQLCRFGLAISRASELEMIGHRRP